MHARTITIMVYTSRGYIFFLRSNNFDGLPNMHSTYGYVSLLKITVKKYRKLFIEHVVCFPRPMEGMGGTPILRSFHRTASSTTGDWNRWYIYMCCIIISTTVSFLELKYAMLFLQVCYFKCTFTFILYVRYVFNDVI